ncbi:MAG: HAMP domain-containing histidine kinase, partial [Rhodospirillaceae bacterium]|nr:HAMP domain-containing histidine kinase [Rhodospirillaceae bacterium]
ERGEIALAPLVDEVALVLPPAQIDAIQWRNDMPGDLLLWADRDQVYRILMNLTKNAFEAVAAHGPGGTVRVTGGRDGDSIFIEVADTGPGLPNKAREHLFEAFSGSVGGTGLGLAIAHELARNHGGRLELLKSDPTGTVFRATFPTPDAPGRKK